MRSYFQEGNVGYDEVRDAYYVALERQVVVRERLYRGDSDRYQLLWDEPNQRQIVRELFINYMRLFRLTKNAGINPKVALSMAEHVYRHDPRGFLYMKKIYPELTLSTIVRAFSHYTLDPMGYARGVRERIFQLSGDYSEIFPPWLIHHAAEYYTDRGSARKFLEQIKEGLRLVEGSGLSGAALLKVVFRNPKDPVEAVKEAEKQVSMIVSEYGLTKTEAEVLVSGYEGSAERMAQRLRERADKFITEFPGVGKGSVRKIVLDTLGLQEEDVRARLRRCIEERERLNEKYPTIKDFVINRITKDYPGREEEILIRTIGIVDSLKSRFPGAKDHILYHAAISQPDAPEEFLRKHFKLEPVIQ